jgi:predicted permease
VISEIGLAVVLLVCAGMLGRTLLHFASLDPGVNVNNVITARANLSPRTLENAARTRAAWQDVLERARRVPGIESIAMVDTVPMREGNNPIPYWTTADLTPEDKQPLTMANSVTPDYLRVVGLKLREGRFFTDQDRLGAEGVVVIDDVMAQEAFHGEEPLGKHLWIDMGSDPVRVVGVMRHVRYWGPASDDESKIRAQLYYPFAQVPDKDLPRWSQLMSIAARTSIDPLNVVAPLRRAFAGANNDQVIFEVNTLEQLARASIARQRFLMLLFGVFAGLALSLACIGIYGVLSYLTSQRVPEIGVRMTLGANAADVMWMVLRQSLGMLGLGVGMGAAGAFAAGSALAKLVEGMQPNGPSTFALMIPVLTAAGLVASFLPARRASRVDPVKALRQE